MIQEYDAERGYTFLDVVMDNPQSKELDAENQEETGAEQELPADPGVTIVAVGASAGGLEAFSEMLRALPTDTGMAFVLVQHLDPNHESILGRTALQPYQHARLPGAESREGGKQPRVCDSTG